MSDADDAIGSSVSIIFAVSIACLVRSGIACCCEFDVDPRDETVLDLLGGPDEEPFDAVDACRRGEGVFGVCPTMDLGRQVVAIFEKGYRNGKTKWSDSSI